MRFESGFKQHISASYMPGRGLIADMYQIGRLRQKRTVIKRKRPYFSVSTCRTIQIIEGTK